jgi:hypothetical protein
VSSPYRRSAGCTIATSASRPDGTDYCLPLVARRPVAASSANPRIDGRLDLDHATAAYRQVAARVGASRLVALDFHTCPNFCWERIFSRDRFSAELNGNGGVYLGCHASGPAGTPCLTNSTGNNMVGNKISDPTTDSDVYGNTNFGVAIQIGSRRNHVIGVAGTGDPTNSDAIDENLGCGNDVWIGNSFTGTTPALNTTSICIN